MCHGEGGKGTKSAREYMWIGRWGRGGTKIVIRATIDDVINTVVFQLKAFLGASHYLLLTPFSVFGILWK